MEHGVQFDGKRSTSPRLDISGTPQKCGGAARNPKTGVARSSSARALRCTVKSANERNPHPVLFFHGRLPPPRRRKVGMTSDQRDLYAWGYTHVTMAGTAGSEAARRSQSLKPGLSSDCRLQLACMKLESLVTVGQRYHGEYVPGSCTHNETRPAAHETTWFKSMPPRYVPRSAAQEQPRTRERCGVKGSICTSQPVPFDTRSIDAYMR